MFNTSLLIEIQQLMEMQQLVKKWFQSWEEGKYLDIPVTDGFRHTSPYGTITGKKTCLELVAANTEKFLGNKIEIRDELYQEGKACEWYTLTNKAFSMEVSEWLYKADGLIGQIGSYYNIESDILGSRKLLGLE